MSAWRRAQVMVSQIAFGALLHVSLFLSSLAWHRGNMNSEIVLYLDHCLSTFRKISVHNKSSASCCGGFGIFR